MIARFLADFVPENRGTRWDKICKKSCNQEIIAPSLWKMNFIYQMRNSIFSLGNSDQSISFLWFQLLLPTFYHAKNRNKTNLGHHEAFFGLQMNMIRHLEWYYGWTMSSEEVLCYRVTHGSSSTVGTLCRAHPPNI